MRHSVVLQVSPTPLSSLRTAATIFRLEGPRGFYRGFGTSLTGTVTVAAVANAAAGVSAAVAAQVVWTPIDVVSQRLMVQGSGGEGATRYRNGIDAFRKILMADGMRGLYRGFGMSILTYAPSNAVWWASYSLSQRTIWGGIGYYLCRSGGCETSNGNNTSGDSNGASDRSNSSTSNVALTPGCKAVVAVQAVSAAVAGGMAALVTMPLDTIKTRMQVLDGEEGGGGGGKKAPMTVARTVRSLLREGGWAACYRGLGPRWASMSMSATTMITTYEFLKRLSAKSGALDGLA